MTDNTFYWQLYISTYTALLGIPFLFMPGPVLPLMGFEPTQVESGPFVRLTGMFLLSLTVITFRIWQKRISDMVLGTIVVRVFIIATLLVVGLTGGFPFLLIMAAVVAIGVVGTIWSLRGVDLAGYL